MPRKFESLPASELRAGVGFHKPAVSENRRVTLNDAATSVMTDFKKVRALTIQATATMQNAQNKMIANGVRLLLVVDIHNDIVGLITSTDITGEKPVRIVNERRISRAEVQVGDVMTPRNRLEAVDMDDLVLARVGHVVETLKAVGRRHALVIDTDEKGVQTVRGLFSATQVEKQLGVSIETTEIARSFAQVGEMLLH
jgi:CBS domain containing-hemolysin-like protein